MNEQDLILVEVAKDLHSLQKYCGTDSVVTIPKSVFAIEKEAFRGNEHIEKVIIPITVKHIDELAFAECKNLKTVEIHCPSINFKKNPFFNSASEFEIIFKGTKADFEKAAGKVKIAVDEYQSGDYHHPTATHFEYYKTITYSHIFSSDEYEPFTCTVKCSDGELVYHQMPYQTRQERTT